MAVDRSISCEGHRGGVAGWGGLLLPPALCPSPAAGVGAVYLTARPPLLTRFSWGSSPTVTPSQTPQAPRKVVLVNSKLNLVVIAERYPQLGLVDSQAHQLHLRSGNGK